MVDMPVLYNLIRVRDCIVCDITLLLDSVFGIRNLCDVDTSSTIENISDRTTTITL